MKTLVLILLSASTVFAVSNVKTQPQQKTTAAPAAKTSSGEILSQGWYTMQAGSTPWGYYHEQIEKKDGRYAYRYEMTKKENGSTFLETLGAISSEDLTPIAFNLSKAGDAGTEIVNATFSKTPQGSIKANIDIKGARNQQLTSVFNGKTILEVFFPVWLLKNSSTLAIGKSGGLKVFTEDGSDGQFRVKDVRYTAKAENKAQGCVEFAIELETQKSIWCMDAKGSLVFMKINGGQAQVQRVKSEAEAKAMIDGAKGN